MITKEKINRTGQPVNADNKELHYYDLDGTLSSLNSTFDFIYGYLKYSKKYTRLYLGKLIMLVLIYTRTYHPIKSRRLLIMIFFRYLKKEALEEYFEEIYRPIFFNSLTSLGHLLMKDPARADVMLTGCTEIPAKKIAALFGFKKLISTEFFYKNGKIESIKQDTYGNLKIKYISKESERMIYYTDDLRSEKSLISIMDEILEVNKI
ncbi:HAD family hydrolase [Autumnicola musiva]|uniref:HAD family hydrolase n=1 Tax=Autumnicola musiva TaxID=3075589 RepID=A0ABU3D3A0_9FLAO|nr:HAD family hydrolase [Zunongwangia sp. F117]MDT0675845.1 HAD family hydrolase [Zunongwangia sp. F117]